MSTLMLAVLLVCGLIPCVALLVVEHRLGKIQKLLEAQGRAHELLLEAVLRRLPPGPLLPG